MGVKPARVQKIYMEYGVNIMESAFLLPLVIDYRVSRRVQIYLVLLHALALLALLGSDHTWQTSLPAGGLLIFSLWWHFLRRVDYAGKLTGYRFILDRDNLWWVRDRAGKETSIKLLPGAFVHPCMVVIRFAANDSKKYALILSDDNLDAETLRRLRVRLRYPTTGAGIK